MRAINVGELLDLARQRARAGGESLSKFLDDYKFDTDDPIGSYLTALAAESQALSTTRPRTGRKGNGIDHYLTWAIRYADKTRAGVRNPHAALAVEHPGFSTNYIRDTVTDARRRYQLLTDAGQGRAGGELTAKALALIAKRQGTKQGDDNG
jgi:hypothetical protein